MAKEIRKVVLNAPRELRAHIRRTGTGLYALSPNQTGKPGWRFAIPYAGRLVVVSKKAVAKTEVKEEAVRRFGVAAKLATFKTEVARKVA